ncbi:MULTISPECIES: LacI family DNA-binding transcriptional regulator [Streptomyces]|uniref:LacI family transcriptional regulator n=1 Tax=Streptomyces cacaoi TaxID=1898 RepID=A0A4Y3R640_STRCI|nr:MULTISPECIES: LacI family DNA-binding transcriptional regulator [Streptomyces]NNG87629.1 LacI family transcriptional regulator [Streptomyces cacaoi]QHF98067.1 LacI family transcriptional regulator [Streptomyces sp. NHF165]GEB53161.1 LacI family transcriptional regulator [Streptomyces cacaoi]
MTAAEKHQASGTPAARPTAPAGPAGAAPGERCPGPRGGSTRRGRAGIRDVAAAAGVSITTVSDALNGKGRLPDATRRHVREVAERLGYRPSAAARTLRTGKSGLIGLTVTTYGEEPFTFTEFAYFAEMARAATSAALARGYALVILPAPARHSPFDVWSNVALDGTVVIDPSDQDPVVSELVRSGIPVVSDGRPSGALPVTAWVDNDHEEAVHALLDHLAESGARRIGLLTGTSTDTYTRLSTRAYLRWCENAGQDPVYEAYPAHDPCAGAVAADRLLARPDRPDAVYGLFDPNGTDLLAAARRYGLRVPEDLLLVCCSESTVYETTEPPITTLSLKPGRIGNTVIQLLIDAIEGIGPPRPVQQVMPTDLLVRTSSLRPSPRTTVAAPRRPGPG